MFRSSRQLLVTSRYIGRAMFSKEAKFFELPSAVFVTSLDVYSPLRPHIDSSLYDDIKSLHAMYKSRGVDIDLKTLMQMKSNEERFQQVTQTLLTLGSELEFHLNEKRRVPSEDPEFDNKIYKISDAIGVVKDKLIEARNEYKILGEEFVLPYLKLPNILHPRTGTSDATLFEYKSKPSFSFCPKSHIEIGVDRKDLCCVNVSMNSVYLSNNFAILELAMVHFLLKKMVNGGYHQWSNIDFAKAVTVEGCGLDVHKDVFELEDHECKSSSLQQYLVGGASLPSFVSLFCKRIIQPNSTLPFKFVTSGRNFRMKDPVTNPTLFDTCQSTCVSSLIAYSYNAEDTDDLINQVINSISEIYTNFEVHFRLTKYSSLKLKNYESLAVGVEMFSPYSNCYEEVGRISILGDFVSKRLQCWRGIDRQSVSKLGFIYVEVMNIQKFIGCLVENTQTSEANYEIPESLEPHMFGANVTYY